MTRFGERDWDAVVAMLRDADDVALACHVNPDGDALGSLLGLSLGLRSIGKSTRASWGSEPAEVPFAYAFMPGASTLVQPEALRGAATFVSLDCGAGDRLGSLEEVARTAGVSANIDHHPGNEMFGTYNVVVTTVSSTAEIVTRLLQDLGVTIDRDIATCLYVGIVTDTGRFQYANSTPDTLRLAADLLQIGVDAPAIAQEVYESAPFGFLKLVGRVLDRAQLFEDERFVYSYVTRKDLTETGVAVDETDKLIDMVRSTRAADVAALFKEQDDGRWRVSLRSKGPGVGALARARGGGGHDLAAGFSANDVTDTVVGLLSDLRAGA